jgi:hypothetical protein
MEDSRSMALLIVLAAVEGRWQSERWEQEWLQGTETERRHPLVPKCVDGDVLAVLTAFES